MFYIASLTAIKDAVEVLPTPGVPVTSTFGLLLSELSSAIFSAVMSLL